MGTVVILAKFCTSLRFARQPCSEVVKKSMRSWQSGRLYLDGWQGKQGYLIVAGSYVFKKAYRPHTVHYVTGFCVFPVELVDLIPIRAKAFRTC